MLSGYSAVLVYVNFDSKIFFAPELKDLPPEWHTTYIMPFEIYRTYIVFPELYIYAIVKNILYQLGVTDNPFIQLNFITLKKYSLFIVSSPLFSLGVHNISFLEKCVLFDHSKLSNFVQFGKDKLFICK